jgi:hypothetical protein
LAAGSAQTVFSIGEQQGRRGGGALVGEGKLTRSQTPSRKEAGIKRQCLSPEKSGLLSASAGHGQPSSAGIAMATPTKS